MFLVAMNVLEFGIEAYGYWLTLTCFILQFWSYLPFKNQLKYDNHMAPAPISFLYLKEYAVTIRIHTVCRSKLFTFMICDIHYIFYNIVVLMHFVGISTKVQKIGWWKTDKKHIAHSFEKLKIKVLTMSVW